MGPARAARGGQSVGSSHPQLRGLERADRRRQLGGRRGQRRGLAWHSLGVAAARPSGDTARAAPPTLHLSGPKPSRSLESRTESRSFDHAPKITVSPTMSWSREPSLPSTG